MTSICFNGGFVRFDCRTSTTRDTKGAESPYQLQLFSNFPLYTTRLVCEKNFPFCDRTQISTPADVAPILQEYFRDPEQRPPSGSRNYVPRISTREPRVI